MTIDLCCIIFRLVDDIDLVRCPKKRLGRRWNHVPEIYGWPYLLGAHEAVSNYLKVVEQTYSQRLMREILNPKNLSASGKKGKECRYRMRRRSESQHGQINNR